MALHLIKLCVGCDTIEDLLAWRRTHKTSDWTVHTRQTPKRAEELLDGGSLFRVFKGSILCRQAITAVQTIGEGKARRCEIHLDGDIVRVAPVPRRPFQGWRYFRPDETPIDLPHAGTSEEMPAELAGRLRELGAW